MADRQRQTKEYYNRKARFEYKIEGSIESGIMLKGPEIKALRSGRIDLSGSYAKIINGEVFWLGANFNIVDEPQRTRKLLLKESEIKRLVGKVSEEGYTLVPLKLYFKKGRAKLELGVGKGMKKYDKRELLKKRDIERELRLRTNQKTGKLT